MQTDISTQLRLLSDKISAFESDIALERFLLADEPGNSRKELRLTLKSRYLTVFLRSRRLLLCAGMLRRGNRSCRELFQTDWKEILEALQYLWADFRMDEAFLSDAVDLICLADPDQRHALLQQLDFKTRLKVRAPKPLSQRVSSDGVDMAAQAMDADLMEDAFSLLYELISLSRKRNPGLPDRHREIVHRSLWYIVDFDPGLACRICDAEKGYFESVPDFSSSRFFWYYGIALLNTNRIDEAISALTRCHRLCLQVEGDRSWIGARARLSCLWIRFASAPDPETEQELWDMLRKIETDYFEKTDHTREQVAAFTRVRILRYHMEQQNLRGLLPELERVLEFCLETADEPVNPLMTVRHTENMISAYYMETGDYLQAAHHATLARDAYLPESITAIPSDVLLYSNMLKLYTALNDTEKMWELIDLLDDMWDTYADDDYLLNEISATINLARSKLGLAYGEEEDLEEALKDLLEIHQAIQEDLLEPEGTATQNIAFFQWTAGMIASILDEASPAPKDLRRLGDVITYFLDNPQIYPLSNAKKMTAYGLLAICHSRMDSPKAMDYMEQVRALHSALTPFNESWITMLRFGATVYFKFGKPRQALDIITEMLSGVTAAWQRATAYLNDRKVCQLLWGIQDSTRICCAILRSLCDSETLYERILQFKDLPALAGRERNRLLRLTPVDSKLRDEIFSLQDRLAAAEMNDATQGSAANAALYEELQEKEAAFAAKFPQNLRFTPISFREMCRKLPVGSAVLEYFFLPPEEMLCGNRITVPDMIPELFVTVNRDGNPYLIHLTVPEGIQVRQDAVDFIQALQDPDDLELAGRKELLRERLFRSLIQPVLEDLEGISTLYIAPDDILGNLPFEILQRGSGSEMLQNRFRILRLVSGRDLLFADDSSIPSGGGFILGDPDYDTDRGEQTGFQDRRREDDPLERSLTQSEPVSRLPFSGIEAERIARRFRCQAHTGNRATKYALQDALPRGLIHLATHGIFDDEGLAANSLYSSCLVFAGYNSWLNKKSDIPHCGNGILTADEISRMNLSGTHLVVLSACQSGLGSTNYHSTQGLLSAFSAAGVRWVISHMWHANDLATAILMDAFYEAHLTLGMDVPDALSHAKQYLRTVTVGQLRRNGWFEESSSRLGGSAGKQLERLRKANDRKQFFADEYYWGGFVCHKCK